MLRSFLAIAMLAMTLSFGAPGRGAATASISPATVAYAQLALFSTEAAAQAHCPRDVVVWLNTKTGIWHEKGMRWYGRTKYGAYVCRKEAAAAGDRDTENGQ